MSRLVLTPVFAILFLMGMKGWALGTFAVAGFTDLIDGTVARLTGKPSKGGALLDPIADKLLVETSFALLVWAGLLPLWFFLLALARDLMIVGGIIYLTRVKAPLPYGASLVSKCATLMQLAVTILGLILWKRVELYEVGDALQTWFEVAVVVAALLILISGVHYTLMGLRILRTNKQRKDERA